MSHNHSTILKSIQILVKVYCLIIILNYMKLNMGDYWMSEVKIIQSSWNDIYNKYMCIPEYMMMCCLTGTLHIK
jgi:hypothetical protein